MSDKKITLFAENPVKIDGKRVHQKTFKVDTQEQADALIACGAASDPSASTDDVFAEEQAAAEKKAAAEKEAAEKEAADKAAAEKKAADEKVAADKEAVDKAAAEKKAADEKEAADKSGSVSNVAQLKQAPKDETERLAAIKVASEELMLARTEENFTNNNGPTVDALEAKLGWTPKAAERNLVWVDLAPAE